MYFKSLQKRYTMFMLLPVALLMAGIGMVGFIYARNQLLKQWGEATALKLQRAAHSVDMRLNKPKEMLRLFHSNAGVPQSDDRVHRLIIDELKGLDGVRDVNLTWVDQRRVVGIKDFAAGRIEMHARPGKIFKHDAAGMLPSHSKRIVDITPPRFDATAGAKTISLVANLKDSSDRIIGRMEVHILFSYLMDAVEGMIWWRDHKSFLVDENGMILTSNIPEGRNQFGETNDPVELSTIKAMQAASFGTVFGPGHPPQEVSGFYKLEEAPWTLVMIVPGSEVLAPIIRMRMYYFIFGGIFILLILFLIRMVTGGTIRSIKDVSSAASRVAEGDYTVALFAPTADEVGELIQSFNTMTRQLEERGRMKYSLNLAKEVQQNLLPTQSIRFGSLGIAGQSIYCDETGGDYYDFMEFSELGTDRMAVAVGDVSGHGVSSALFMTTARAMLRSRTIQAGRPAQIITDVNRLLCFDTAQTGNFMTLFYLIIDAARKELSWVRAGHEPGILYDPAGDAFIKLDGAGIALGVDETYVFESYSHAGLESGQMVLIGTDGIWETENVNAERFGKARLREVMHRNRHEPAEKVVAAVSEALLKFRGNAPQTDDITLVVVKAERDEIQ